MSNGKIIFVEIQAEKIKHITDDAVLVEIKGREEEKIWIPRSVLSTKTDKALDDFLYQKMVMEISDWFVNKKGL